MSAVGDPVRIAVVGCGRLTEHGYVPAIARVREARLVGVADPDPIRRERAAGLAASLGVVVPAFTGIESLLDAVSPDAVVLASPAAAHVDGARIATAAGVTVLVEKPPAPDATGAEQLAALRPRPWIAFNRRFDPGVRSLRAERSVEVDGELRLSIAYRRRSWRAHTVRDDALDDLGPHLVDWARWLTGQEIVAVTARTVSDQRAEVVLRLERSRARIVAATDRLHAERIEWRAPDGRRVARWTAGGPVRAVTGRFAAGDHPLVTSLAGQLDAFVHAVGGRPAPDLATAEDGAAAMRAIAACRASAASGGVDVPVASLERS